ncbi:MAG: IS3 family transposase [Candidatus Binatota bacterium]|nr:IS3 family transposase [Candidatus Binatota bacterium]
MKREDSIEELAEALEVSKSGFYAHLHKLERPRRRGDQRLRALIRSSFEQSRATYGCPRIRFDLRERGEHCGKNRIARLMREEGLRPKQKRRFRPCTTQSAHHHKIAENWLTKVPTPDRPGRVWQSDITYIETAEGWLYLAFTLDAFSRRVVAHYCREDLLVELTTTTFDLATTRQRPLAGLIHHSDRGSQYAAEAFQGRLSSWRVTSSMSRKGNPYDNALAESFVATLKAECFGGLIPPTKAAAKLMVFDYVETFYNRRRRHSALGYRSPLKFEEDFVCSLGEGCSGVGGQGGETCLPQQVGSSRLGCEQLPRVVQAAGNNPVQSSQDFNSTP